jgi:Cys-tRNA synthase (O-phospho-L-seryl-tRNA:Cys-tRNA synthase)
MHDYWFQSIVIGLLTVIAARPILEDREKRWAEKIRQQREDEKAARDLDGELLRDRALQDKLNSAAKG